MRNLENSTPSRVWLSAVLDAAPDAMLFVDSNGVIVSANKPMHSLFGYSDPSLVGMSVEDLLPEARRGAHVAFRSAYAAAPTRREMGSGRELIGVRSDGTTIAIEVGLSPLATRAGNFVVCVVRDVSLRKAAEASMRELNAALERRVSERTAELQNANRDLEALSYSMAHDARAPLRAINAFAELLAQNLGTALDAESQRLIKIVRDRAVQVGDMLNDYLRIVGVRRHELDCQPVALDELIARCWSRIAPRYTHRVQLTLSALPTVSADPALLELALTEVLDNAAKFTSDAVAPCVTVTAASEDNVCVTISDNGVGFDAAHAGRLFGIFERLHPARFVGNGVGLALAKRVVERHGGTVTLTSDGVGASCTMCFPSGPSRARHDASVRD